MNKTLFRYIFGIQLKATVFISVSVFFLILLFDFAEVMRKFPISNASETLFAIKLSLLRTPSTFSEILRYAYFVAVNFCLWNLCRSHQMTILKAIGISPKRILYPFFGFAVLVAGIWLFIIHPAGLFLEARYNENVSPNNASAEINRDVWIDCRKNDKLIFVKSICGNEIEGLNVFDIKNNSKIFAQKAISRKDVWHLENVAMVNNDKIKNVDFMEIPCVVSPNFLELISKSSRKQNIYYLYEIYKIQKKDKVTLRLYELELHNLLANCFCFLLFALIAAVICFPINRYKTKTDIAIKALFATMLLRFANNALESLAYGGAIPPQFACWAVPLILTLVSIAVLIWREA